MSNDKLEIYPGAYGGPPKGGGKGQQPPKGRKSGAFKALVAIFIVLVVALIGLVGFYVFKFSNMYDKGFDTADVSDEGAGDLSSAEDQDGNVTGINKGEEEVDILMIGVDNREDEFTGRSDVMMYLRVNTEEKTIKLVSFMRDTLVKIDGHKKKPAEHRILLWRP